MSHLVPRDYQLRAVDDLSRELTRNPILVIPTGGGKTFVASLLIDQLRLRTLWIAHRRELISQAAQRLTACGLRCGVIAAGYPEQRSAPVQVGSIQTLVRRQLPPADLVVVDECHHARAGQYRKVLDEYPGIPVVGLTATPFRLDGKGLGDVGFGAIVVAAWPDELVAQGSLVEPVVYAPAVPDLAGVRMHHGDYSEAALHDALDRPHLVGDIVETWRRLAAGRRTVVFAVDVQHSQHVVSEFGRAGVRAEHIDGSTSVTQRDATLHRLRIGYTTVVSQCMVLTEGWDLPALEVAVLARPTASLCLHLQQIGRICRAAPDKTGALVLDHAGNHLRLGTMTQRLEYTLGDVESASRRRGAEEGEPRMKRCPQCYLIVSPSAQECSCGYQWPAPERSIEHVDGELQPFAAPTRTSVPFAEQRQAWLALQAQREHWAKSIGWAKWTFKQRFGFWPLLAGEDLVDPQSAGHGARVLWLADLIQTARRKSYKDGWAKHAYFREWGRWPTKQEWVEAERRTVA